MPDVTATPRGFNPGATAQRFVSRGPTTYDAESRTVEAVFTTTAPVRRYFGDEVLSMDPEAVDLSRIERGQVRLLDHHKSSDRAAILGTVESGRIEGDQLVGRLRFADTPAAREAEGMVARGEFTGVSIGYRILKWTLISVDDSDHETWRADRWELLEVSLVSVPADPNAGLRSLPPAPSEAPTVLSQENIMPDPVRTEPGSPAETAAAAATAAATATATEQRAAPAAIDLAADRARAAEIALLARRSGMAPEAADAAIVAGTSIEAFRAQAFDHLAARSDAQGARTSVSVTRDDGETRRSGMTEAVTAALAHASGSRSEVGENARRFMGFSLAEMAADSLGERRMPRTARDREEVLARAFHTTSDFPIIFGGAINARLLASYTAAQPVYRRIASQTSFVDFRAHDQIRPGDFPMPVAVGQAGEIKFGTFGEKKESIAVAPFGVQFNITRQMLVNDNLGAIDRVMSGYGTTIALFEDITFFAMKGVASGAGPTLTETSRAVFNTTDGNLAGSGTAISTTAIGAGRAAMRKIKRLDGNAMGLAPSLILVSPDKETEVETVLAAIAPAVSTNVNLFSGRLTPIVSAQLTGNAWELYVDPSVGSNWAWGLLDGYTAPRLRMDEKFGVQGVGISLEHDFGCGAIDFRFGYRNAGA